MQTICLSSADYKSQTDKLHRQDVSLLLGNIADQFETALYGLLAPILSPLFFPEYSPVVQLILAYSFLGTGIVTRPIGAIIFGWIAKRFGPQLGLSYSIVGVAIATVGMAVLPCFAVIGWGAPVALLFIRIIKGVFAAGENTIARLYIVETKVESTALKAAYYYETSTMVGIIAASLAANVVMCWQEQQILWRLCFLFGGVVGCVSSTMRIKKNRIHLQQSQVNINNVQFNQQLLSFKYLIKISQPIIVVLKQQHRNLLKIFLACSFSYLTYVIPFILLNSLVPLISGVTLESMLQLNTMFLVLDLLLIPTLGYCINKYMSPYIDKVMACAALVLALTIIPLFMLLANTSLGLVIFIRLWIVFWGIVFLCPLNLWYGKLLQRSPDRFLTLGIGESLAAGTVGHLSPAICLGLWHTTGSILYPAIYVAILMLAAVGAVITPIGISASK